MKPWKTVTVGLWVLAALSVAAYAAYTITAPKPAASTDMPDMAVAAAVTEDDGKLPVMFDTPSFELTDQNGEIFNSDQLKGKVWVGFIFLTHCPSGACPTMIGKMAKLQDALPDERVNFVSFTIDPDRDTPEALKAYAEKVGGESVSPRWHLLTGTTRAKMLDLAHAMNLTFDDENQHTTFFLLVDADGNVRGLYGNTDDNAMDKLQHDADELLANGGR